MLAFLMTVKISRRLAFNNGSLPIVIGIFSFIVPFFGGLSFRNLYTNNIDPLYLPAKKALAERTVIITTQSAILLPTITYFLSELKILNSELGRLVLSSSLISDILSVTAGTLAHIAGTYKNKSPMTAYRDFIGVVVLILIVFCILRPAIDWILERIPIGGANDQA
ncbi:Cation/H(+) antiporter 12 [Cardamine amara subsp. amara]|uniref:Cation/H(+) antiporter 12 n=1 Tax=Cardamine amara subsp. amara TaxID=228776 RepID=A0ABD1A1Z3_CARAN